MPAEFVIDDGLLAVPAPIDEDAEAVHDEYDGLPRTRFVNYPLSYVMFLSHLTVQYAEIHTFLFLHCCSEMSLTAC